VTEHVNVQEEDGMQGNAVPTKRRKNSAENRHRNLC